MSEAESTYFPLSQRDKLDGKLVAQATRLVIASGISLVLLVTAIVAGFVVLREEMETQKYLVEASEHVNVMHRTITESISLLQDFRDETEVRPPNIRLIQLIKRRIDTTIEGLDRQAKLLVITMSKLEGSADWHDFEWLTSTSDEGWDVLMQGYIRQMRKLNERDIESEMGMIRPQIPAEAAGARHGSLSTGLKDASEQLAKNIAQHSHQVELIHQRLTYLILGMFFLMCFLIVLPLWRRLIREHKRHQLAHDKLHQMAFTDQETGLPNLDGFEQHVLPKAVSLDAIHNHYLILVRIGNLNEISNLVGSQRMSKIHRDFSARLLSSQVRKFAWARSSDSEYATVITQRCFNTSGEWVEQFYDALARPIKISGILARPAIAIAVSRLEKPEFKGISLLREHQANARMALPYFDRMTCQLPVYKAVLTHELTKQNELITAITSGVENREFMPFYQIKVDAVTGDPSSMEVLCRWTKAGKEMVGPQIFIPAAEKSGQIVPLTYQLVEQVVSDVKQWSRKGFRVGPVAVNVSIDILQHKDFFDRFLDARNLLLACDSDLEVEITENVVIENSTGMIRRILAQLRSHGVKIAIDDFGTGYASLRTLIDLPFDTLKIDRSFVVPMTKSGVGNEVLSSMISLSSKLGKRSVVEGVEFVWQQDALVEMGADELQGNLFYKPASAEEVTGFFHHCTKINVVI